MYALEAQSKVARCDSDSQSTSAGSEEEWPRPPPGFEDVTPEMLFSSSTRLSERKRADVGMMRNRWFTSKI